MIKNPLLVAATLALCCPTAYAQASGGVITPPPTKPDGSVITPPASHADPGIERSPDMGTNQSQLPKNDTNPRSGGMKGPGGAGPGAQAPETPSVPAPGTGSGSTR
jgi:hypothetical protein